MFSTCCMQLLQSAAVSDVRSGKQVQYPHLLTCRLFDWIASILGAISCIYIRRDLHVLVNLYTSASFYLKLVLFRDIVFD